MPTAKMPKLESTIGKKGKSLMPPEGEVINFEVIDEVRTFQGRSKEKIVMLQLVQFRNRKREIRVGYYIIGKKPKMKGKWVWGQFAAFMPIHTFERLHELARKKGWF